MESPRMNSIVYVSRKGRLGNLTQDFVHGTVSQAPARWTSMLTSMAMFLFVGESLTWRSFRSPPIISPIRLLRWWFGAKWGTFPPCMVQLSLQICNLTLRIPIMLRVGDVTLPTKVAPGGMSCMYTPLMVFSPFGTPSRITMLGTPWLCLVQVNILLMQSRRGVMWTHCLHQKRCTRSPLS